MDQFSFGEKYRLEVHWQQTSYDEGCVKLDGCELKGPVLTELTQLEIKDAILLDFISQYISLLPQYYIAKLSWKGVTYKEGAIALDNVIIDSDHINSLPTLNDNDFLVIDTSNHEDEKHNYSINYRTYVIKPDGAKYNFNKG